MSSESVRGVKARCRTAEQQSHQSESILIKEIDNVNGMHFLVSANDFAPHSFRKTNGEISGNHYKVLESGALRFNFTYSLEISEGKSTGVKLGNGSWSGMMNDITEGACDIALVIAVTENRMKAADFTTPMGVSHLIFVSTVPFKSVSNVALLTPLHYKVWIFIGIAFTFQTLGIYLMLKLRDDDANGESFLDVVLWTIGLSTEQSFPLPKHIKSIAVIWVAFVLIIGTGYKCNLASFLSTPEPLRKPVTFLQLHNATQYSVYFDISGISGYDFFRKSEQTWIKDLRKRIVPTSSTSDCVISSFNDRTSVCIGWDISLPVAVAKNLSVPYKHKVTMYQSMEYIVLTYPSIAFRKNFAFKNLFNFIGMSCFEAGLIQKWTKDAVDYFICNGKQWSPSVNGTHFYEQLQNFYNYENNSENNQALRMKHFTTLFLSFILGLAFATATFLWELITY
ncbi:uncharacterized protein LOC110844724 [Folsomia candida]|uniref:uncharacterized protein LOC110844724 n=1 Tax=Folsomia candida TaxID=158441 RepID=UPI000B8F2F83|nr:uncharacterized protein LOC110844724 [Folsomia candida]